MKNPDDVNRLVDQLQRSVTECNAEREGCQACEQVTQQIAQVMRRAVCLDLAIAHLPPGSSLGEHIVAADYLDRGYVPDAGEDQ